MRPGWLAGVLALVATVRSAVDGRGIPEAACYLQTAWLAIRDELEALGASETVARRMAGNARSYWRNADRLLKTVLIIAYFDRLGTPCLS